MIGLTTTLTPTNSNDGAENVAHRAPDVAGALQELTALYAVAEALNRAHDLRTMMQTALSQMVDTLGVAHGLAYRLIDSTEVPDEQCLSLVAWSGFSEAYVHQVTMLPLYGSMVAQAALTGQPMVWPVAQYPNLRLRQLLMAEGVHLGITIPLLAQGRLLGALSLGAGPDCVLTETGLRFLATVGQLASSGVETTRLREAVHRPASNSEPSRVTRALYDSVVQHLYSMTLYAETISRLLDSAENTQAADYVQSLHAIALEALHEMRLLLSELHPPELAKIGLVAALQARFKALTGWSGIAGDFVVEGGDMAGFLPLVMQQELYYVALEALNNALKHASAHRIEIALRVSNGSATLDVRDDGIGFGADEPGKTAGCGLRSMQERMQRIGGTLHIESAPGQGTQIRVTA